MTHPNRPTRDLRRKADSQRLSTARTIRLPPPLLAALDELAVVERKTTGELVTFGDVVRRVLTRDVEVAATMRIAEQRKRKAAHDEGQLALPVPKLRRARRAHD